MTREGSYANARVNNTKLLNAVIAGMQQVVSGPPRNVRMESSARIHRALEAHAERTMAFTARETAASPQKRSKRALNDISTLQTPNRNVTRCQTTSASTVSKF
jgi:hypothetical protein